MAHPSIQRAREMLAHRHEQEAEHELWRAEHANELSDARLAELRARQLKCKDYSGDLIYKTTEAPPPAPAPQLDDAAWNDWASAHCDVARQYCNELVLTLADEVGAMHGKLAKRVRQLSAEVQRLKKELSKDVAS